MITPLTYSPTGSFTSGSASVDFDEDGDVDQDDFTSNQPATYLGLSDCFTGPDVAIPPGEPACDDKDLDDDGDVDAADYAKFQVCMSGSGAPPPPGCGGDATPKQSGTFAMHGLTVDVLADGHALLFARARHYDLKHGRWLQRDPKGYVDGSNLYEAFGGNATRFTDPMGTDAVAEFFLGPAGKNVSTWNSLVGPGEWQETLAWLTFGLVDLSNNPTEKARRSMAVKEGVVSPSITAGEIALTGPTGRIKSFVYRNLVVGLIFASGEATRDYVVEGQVQTPLEFGQNTAVFATAGMVLEGIVIGGGKAYAWFRGPAGEVALVEIGQPVAAQSADEAVNLVKVVESGGFTEAQLTSGLNTAITGESTIIAAQGGEPFALIVIAEGFPIPSTVVEQGLRPQILGLQTISDDVVLHTMWNDAMKSAAASTGRQNAYQRLLILTDEGAALTSAQLREGFEAVNSRFMQSARAAGYDIGAVHHWNYDILSFPQQIVDPRHLVPLQEIYIHEMIHRITSQTSRVWEGPVAPQHVIRIPEVSSPLPGG